MFGSSRGGVRGGQDQFSWEDVKTDKQRENYLGERGCWGCWTRGLWGAELRSRGFEGAPTLAPRTGLRPRRQLADGPGGPLAEGPRPHLVRQGPGGRRGTEPGGGASGREAGGAGGAHGGVVSAPGAGDLRGAGTRRRAEARPAAPDARARPYRGYKNVRKQPTGLSKEVRSSPDRAGWDGLGPD